MSRVTVAAASTAAFLCLALPVAAQATTTSLLLPQSSAFAVLGHSCGGIQEQAFATGFDPGTGFPVGAVYLQTRCGGSGRGGGYHVTTYSAWASATWDMVGRVVSYARLGGSPSVDPAFSAYDGQGDHLYNAASHAYLDVVPPAAPTGLAAAASVGQ